MNNQLPFIPELEKELRPLFKKMYYEINNINDYWLFCATWGKYFPSTPNNGIIFYGRSTNGWKDYTYPIDYSGNPDDIFSFLFNRMDQVEWMPDNTQRPFVNLIKKIAEKYYPVDWNEHIAWSNVCKVAPNKGWGTPSTSLWDEQYWHCVKTMEVELRLLSPKVIVFITGSTAGERWDWPLFEIERYKNLKFTESIEWGETRKGYPLSSKGGVINNQIIIITDRPERRPIIPHSEAIMTLIERLSNKI